jgi:integrase-like protein
VNGSVGGHRRTWRFLSLCGLDALQLGDDDGRLIDDDPRRFGFHNLRHSLASFLVRIRTDPKTIQTLLRHSDVKLTLQCYPHCVSEDRMAAAGAMLTAIFSHAADRRTESGLSERQFEFKSFTVIAARNRTASRRKTAD